MDKKTVFGAVARLTVMALLLAACATPTPAAPTQAPPTSAPPTQAPPTTAPTEAPTAVPTEEPQAMPEGARIYYADARTWPSQSDMLTDLSHGKFYIPVQDDGMVAVIDPEAENPLVKLIPIAAAQPHHPWAAPGMRYMYINHQSEGKGDHNVMTVIDTFTDEVVAEIKTDFDDPFHCSFSPTNEQLLLCGDLNPEGGYVYYIDPTTHTYLSKVKTSGKQARDVIQTHDGQFAFVGHQGEGNLDVLDVEKAEVVKTIECNLCARLKMTPDGKLLFASSPKGNFTAIVDVATQEIVKTLEFEADSGPGNINFAMNGAFAMIGLGKAGKLALVDIAKLEVAAILDTGKSTNTAYANPANPSLAIATNDGEDDWYSLIDVANLTVIEQAEAGGKASHNVQWSADGRYGVGSDRLGDTITLFRYDAASGKIEKLASVQVGFGANGVQWVPYFCGAPYLTEGNVKTVKNAAPANANGDCAAAGN